MSWEDTREWLELLELVPCPVLYQGVWDEELIRNLKTDTYDGDEMEGYVVRVAHEYPYSEFRKNVGKYVRAGHVQNSHGHWIREVMVKNELKRK